MVKSRTARQDSGWMPFCPPFPRSEPPTFEQQEAISRATMTTSAIRNGTLCNRPLPLLQPLRLLHLLFHYLLGSIDRLQRRQQRHLEDLVQRRHRMEPERLLHILRNVLDVRLVVLWQHDFRDPRPVSASEGCPAAGCVRRP